jgi:HEAT repeat protein
VRIETLKTLLHLRASDAFLHLKSFLEGKNHELKEKAIILCGQYRVKESVPYLIYILEKRDILDIDMHLKLESVKALGKIGDPSALEVLKNLYLSPKPLIYRETFDEFKTEIIRSMQKYPFEETAEILELAASSNHEKARALARKILSRMKHVKRKTAF